MPIFACFNHISRAVDCAMAIQRAFTELGKSLSFIDRGPIALQGFGDPVRLYQISPIV